MRLTSPKPFETGMCKRRGFEPANRVFQHSHRHDAQCCVERQLAIISIKRDMEHHFDATVTDRLLASNDRSRSFALAVNKIIGTSA